MLTLPDIDVTSTETDQALHFLGGMTGSHGEDVNLDIGNFRVRLDRKPMPGHNRANDQ